MYLSEKHLNQFITQFSGPQNFLRQLCKEEKQRTKIEIEDMVDWHEERKEHLVEWAVKLFKYDTSALKKFLSDSKHELQLLKNDDPDYNLLKEALGLTTETKEVPLKNYSNKSITLRIHRVKSKVERCSCPSLLLLHGTKGCNVEGILREGLRPSSAGSFGPGIYLTNSFERALSYGKCYVEDEGTAKLLTYLFVNKVKETLTSSSCLCRELKNGQSVKFCQPSFGEQQFPTLFVDQPDCQDSSFSYDPVLKVFDANSLSDNQTKFKQSLNCKLDSNGNKILSGTFLVDDDEKRIAVAHHEQVTLAYLIEIEKSTRELVKHVLNGKFANHFSKDPTISEPRRGTAIDNSSAEDCSRNSFVAELEEQITLNQRAEIELAKYHFEYKVNSFMQQLLFEMSSITETNASFKYKAELLQTSNRDYQFVLGSITETDCRNYNPKIVKIYRINPADESETEKMRDSFLFMHGVPANHVLDVLARGYPASREDDEKHCKCGPRGCDCRATTDLDIELLKGTSHCVTNGQLRKLSFVFLASERKIAEAPPNSDTRGCCLKRTETCNEIITEALIGFIPAYLVIFSC